MNTSLKLKLGLVVFLICLLYHHYRSVILFCNAKLVEEIYGTGWITSGT